MADVNPLLTNPALEGLIKDAKLKDKSKEILISKLPDLEEKDRLDLLNFLAAMSFLDTEKEEVKMRIQKFEATGRFE